MKLDAKDASLSVQMLAYAVIGGACALANLGFFALLLAFNLPLLPSAWAGFLLGAVLNYVLCLIFLFRHKARWSASGEMAAYCATVAAMGFADAGMTWLFACLGLAAVWSKTLAIAVGFFGNFFLRKLVVF